MASGLPPHSGEPLRDASGSQSAPTSILDAVAVGVARVALDGRIVEINRQGRKLIGLTSFDPDSFNVHDFEPYTVWPNGNRCTYEEFPPIKCMRTGQSQEGTVIGLKLPSEILWMTVAAEPLFSADGKIAGSLVTVVDSRQPQHVEKSLRQSEDRYRRLVENAPDAIVVHRQGEIVFVNDAGVKLWAGKGPEDFIGRNVLELIDPRDRSLAERRIQRAITEGKTPLIRQRHIRLDGRKIVVEVTGTSCDYDGLPAIQVTFRDVTARRRINRRFQRQREILRLFFNKIPVLVGIYSSDGRAKALNEEWKNVIGWGKEVNLEQLIELLYPNPADRVRAIEYMEAAAPGWADFTVRVKDGSTRQLSWANISTSGGDRIGMALDVTEQRAAEEALRRAKQELEQRVAQRTEQLTTTNAQLERKQHLMEMALAVHERDRKLVAYEIHDVILQEVIGALLYIDSIQDPQQSEPGAANDALEKARKLLRKCIEGARQMISGLRPPIIDEQGVAGAVDFLVSEFAARGLKIHFTHSVPPERLAAELETAIFRIVQEALTNVERHSKSPSAEVDIRLVDDVVRLVIQDRGVGFDTQSVPEGHFGLEGIRERAHLVGGRADFESFPGKGTIVRVEIPAKFAPALDG